MPTFRQDLAYALRQMRLSPVFTLTAMVTLALGIGATTAIFSLINTVMLKSLPVADPSTLYRIGTGDDCCIESGAQDNWGFFSYDFYRRMQQNTPEFSSLAAFQAGGWTLGVRRGQSDRVAKPLRTEMVTGNYFSTLGLGAFAGRTILPSDDQPSSPPVAMLSYRTWQQQYASDPSILGSTFIIGDHPVTIIGVTPPGFFGETLRPNPPDLWLPVNQEPVFAGSNSLLHHFQAWLRVIGRLRPGASTATTGQRMTALLRQWIVNDSGMPADWMAGIKADLPRQNILVIPAGIGVAAMKENYADSLHILLTVCCLVLLIACANIANLLLARGAARRAQTSIRLALGASRPRLIRQTLTESILLSVFGGAAGLVVAFLGIVQATLSVFLLTGAGLLTRSLANLQHQDFGYQLDHRITIGVTAPWSSYSQPQLDALYRELQDRLTHIPGVERAALAQYTPLTDNWGEMVIRQGHGMPGPNEHSGSSWDHVARPALRPRPAQPLRHL
jgi:predicted permease